MRTRGTDRNPLLEGRREGAGVTGHAARPRRGTRQRRGGARAASASLARDSPATCRPAAAARRPPGPASGSAAGTSGARPQETHRPAGAQGRLEERGRRGGGGASGSRGRAASRDADAARARPAPWCSCPSGLAGSVAVGAGRWEAQPSAASRWSLVAAELSAFCAAGNPDGAARGGSAGHP